MRDRFARAVLNWLFTGRWDGLSDLRQPIHDGGLQRDALVGIDVVGFHINFSNLGVAGFAEGFGDGFVVGLVAVMGFDLQNRARFQTWRVVDVVPFGGVLFGFGDQAFRS